MTQNLEIWAVFMVIKRKENCSTCLVFTFHIPSLLTAKTSNCKPNLNLVFSPHTVVILVLSELVLITTHISLGGGRSRNYSPTILDSVWGKLVQHLLPCVCSMSIEYELECTKSARSLAWDWITGAHLPVWVVCRVVWGYDDTARRGLLPFWNQWLCVLSIAPDSQCSWSAKKVFSLVLNLALFSQFLFQA